MLRALSEYYRREGIAAIGFRCPKAASCSKGSGDFITAREPFVGSEYERGTLPRLLFVSLDAGDGWPGREPAKRTLEHVRWAEEGGGPIARTCDPSKLARHRHWWATHVLAHEILSPIAAAHGVAPFTLAEIHRYFAHANSAKCKDAARGTRAAPDRVFANCRPYIREEVALLEPDIIITQGKQAATALHDAFRVMSRESHPQHRAFEALTLDIRGRSALQFTTAHQRALGPYKRDREWLYPWIVEVVQRTFSGWRPRA